MAVPIAKALGLRVIVSGNAKAKFSSVLMGNSFGKSQKSWNKITSFPKPIPVSSLWKRRRRRFSLWHMGIRKERSSFSFNNKGGKKMERKLPIRRKLTDFFKELYNTFGVDVHIHIVDKALDSNGENSESMGS